jgi:hypothetical protein
MIDIDKFLFFILFLQMEHQVYQVVEVCFHIQDRIGFDRLFFIGEKGEPGLPGPGFPGKKIILCYPTNL